MVELAGGMGYRQPHASFTGPGINPWHRDAWSGGSSSGSGSAVVGGPRAVRHRLGDVGVDPRRPRGTAASPASGRPTAASAATAPWRCAGRSTSWARIALTADDCGLVLDAIAGPDAADPTAAARPYRYDGRADPSRRFRFAVLRERHGGLRGRGPRQLRSARSTSCAGSAPWRRSTLPDLPWEIVTRTILHVEAASAFEDLIESGAIAGLTAPEDHYNAYARDAILAKDYVKALRLRRVMAREADRPARRASTRWSRRAGPPWRRRSTATSGARSAGRRPTSWAPSATARACPP